jgi:trans-2,3-dihydro-3-hydroxyanthranilate isomerase
MRRPYHVLDVFTDRPLGGNPLAVVLEADDLDTARMQAIAREFNLSETVFVVRPRDPASTARVRIFTPAVELPFAGHPTVGTAVLLAQLRAGDLLAGSDVTIALEEGVGLVTCTVTGAAPASSARFALPKLPDVVAATLTVEAVAAALDLSPEAIGFDDHQPCAFDAGVPFCFVPLASGTALSRARATGQFAATFACGSAPKAFLYTRETADMAHDFAARMFTSGLGVGEDPATGSAAAAFAGVLAAQDNLGPGTHRVLIEQGYAMGRPSLIQLALTLDGGGGLTAASVGGGAVRVAEGVLFA